MLLVNGAVPLRGLYSSTLYNVVPSLFWITSVFFSIEEEDLLG